MHLIQSSNNKNNRSGDDKRITKDLPQGFFEEYFVHLGKIHARDQQDELYGNVKLD